ncbi:MAG: 6-hydroxymethylpterin diphosphokinase MptE-like protein [Candidatus Kariarchaeaceae archaeon]
MHLKSLPFTIDSWISFWYPYICEKLSISSEDDKHTLDYALEHWSKSSSDEVIFSKLIKGKQAIVFGCGPSLTYDIKLFTTMNKAIEPLIVASDGATQALLENNLVPDLIVTDLDGDPESLIAASKQGSYFLIHVHGDNLDNLEQIMPKIKAHYLLTTQAQPKPPIVNYFGFTDGDRAVFALNHFSADKIILLGFDLGDTVSAYSKPAFSQNTPASPSKKIKMTIAQDLLGWIQELTDISLFNATNGVKAAFAPIKKLDDLLF